MTTLTAPKQGTGDGGDSVNVDGQAAQVSSGVAPVAPVPVQVPQPVPTAGNVITPMSGGKRKIDVALMYDAAIKGDWRAAEILVQRDPNLVRERLTKRGDRPLHIAAAFKQTKFVQELVRRLRAEDLVLLNDLGHTPLHFAIPSEAVDIASVMIEKNDSLITIRMSDISPLQMAVWFGSKKIVSYLYNVSREKGRLPIDEWLKILLGTVMTKQYEVGLLIVERDIQDIRTREKDFFLASSLFQLAAHDLSNISASQEAILKSFIAIFAALPTPPWLRKICEQPLLRKKGYELVEKLCKELERSEEPNVSELAEIVFQAAKVGNVELLTRVTRMDPDLLFAQDAKGHNIFQVALLYRQENVFGLIRQTGALRDFIMNAKDTDGNFLLHLLGVGTADGSQNNSNPNISSNAPIELPGRIKIVSGAALQMQRELLWFKEVEKMSHPQFREAQNKQNLVPKELFSKSHKSLLEEGEKWMKDTSNSCMLMATLIATVAFAAAFTVPGGNDDKNGIPRGVGKSWFDLFVISNAMAMFCSIGAIIMFLSILTSRYMEEDFLSSLPTKLLFGLTALFGSIVGTLLAFTSTFFLLFSDRKTSWIPIFVAAISCVTLTSLFVVLHIRLWTDIFSSTYLSRRLFRPGKHSLF